MSFKMLVVSDEHPTNPEPRQPIEVACTRCWRTEALRLAADAAPAAEAVLAEWHQTKAGWVCPHCWTALDHRRERELCRLCGRDAHAGEDKHKDWQRPDESGDFLCPECEIAGKESVTVQLVKESVSRWQRRGDFPTGYRGLIENALAREREIVSAMLGAKLEREGVRPSEREWQEMLSDAIAAARARWPAPVGEGTATE